MHTFFSINSLVCTKKWRKSAGNKAASKLPVIEIDPTYLSWFSIDLVFMTNLSWTFLSWNRPWPYLSLRGFIEISLLGLCHPIPGLSKQVVWEDITVCLPITIHSWRPGMAIILGYARGISFTSGSNLTQIKTNCLHFSSSVVEKR